jgi:hypothetical protein
MRLINPLKNRCQGTTTLYYDTAPSFSLLCRRKGNELLSGGCDAQPGEGRALEKFPLTPRHHTTGTMSTWVNPGNFEQEWSRR